METSSSRFAFLVFQIKMKNEKQTSNLNSMLSYFENRKNLTWKSKLFSNFVFQFIKKTEMAF